ncbi:MAG: DUF6298 domain-containing protein [Mediterranea sp.]|jgi:hypothetical protein|nr:DUF6298 domain-containing protein [Mediterranea sp.]
MNRIKNVLSAASALLMIGMTGHAQPATFPLQVKDGGLTYVSDDRGNRILDFSYCGYRMSEEPIPSVPNVIFVSAGANASARIQRAIDYVASLRPDASGFRGAVLLAEGHFALKENLRLPAGVVLRGTDRTKTILEKEGVDRGALLYIEGTGTPKLSASHEVTSVYLPVNERTMEVADASTFHPGDRVMVTRPATAEWIHSIGCDIFGGGLGWLGWKPGDNNNVWDRTVVAVDGTRLTLDAPLTVALDEKQGRSTIARYNWEGRLTHAGVENLTLSSSYDKQYPKDEDHCWTGISIANAENCWVRRVNFEHFAGSAVVVQHSGSKITVEDCISSDPVSEIGGLRRRTFLTFGQLCLFQRCYSEHGINDFAAGYNAAGPNAFVQCDSYESLGFSGSIGSWACGLLFDIVNIDGNDLAFRNLSQDKDGAGWNTGNSLFWQCTASEIECFSPAPDAKNRAYGCWAEFSGDGDWAESNNHVQPRSFFYAQLTARLGRDCSAQARILPRSTNATSSPTVAEAAELTKEFYKGRLTLEHWIDEGTFAPSVSAAGVKTLASLPMPLIAKALTPAPAVTITDGRIVQGGRLLVGNHYETPWWSGKLRPSFLRNAKFALTRFVPDQEGTGFTDRIDSVVATMRRQHILVFDQNYGLWYDRRRDDHERVRRRNGDAWAPFYEQPFARSGEGTAWEGLSKYDLTRPNAWYFARLKEFADKGASHGLLLFNENFFQHNILEAGAHWVDCPWRSVNNINHTGFPEPVNFAGDKRLFVGDMFYNLDDPVRKALYRQYIRQCLNAFKDNENVIQLTSAEFTGPLHFVQFWLDVIAEWETETGRKAKVALSATKDVQDAILTDPKRAPIVNIIDIRYWHYKTDGIFAPKGGQHLALRQHMRKMKVGKTTFTEAYKAVNEYRRKYPDKAVTFYAQNFPALGWAVLMAGGSCPVVPCTDKAFLQDAAAMNIQPGDTDSYKALVKSGIGSIIYSQSGQSIPVQLTPGKYTLKYIQPTSGEVKVLHKSISMPSVKGKGNYILETKDEGVYWFHRQ